MTHVRKKKVNMIIDILHSGLFFLVFQRTPFFSSTFMLIKFAVCVFFFVTKSKSVDSLLFNWLSVNNCMFDVIADIKSKQDKFLFLLLHERLLFEGFFS